MVERRTEVALGGRKMGRAQIFVPHRRGTIPKVEKKKIEPNISFNRTFVIALTNFCICIFVFFFFFFKFERVTLLVSYRDVCHSKHSIPYSFRSFPFSCHPPFPFFPPIISIIVSSPTRNSIFHDSN